MATTPALVCFSVVFTSTFSAVFSEWEDATMFSYIDVKDKIAIMAKRMKYFTHKGKRSHLICSELHMCVHAQTFAPFLLASSHREHNTDLQCPVNLASGPQCGRRCGRAVWLQASGADVCYQGLVLTTGLPAFANKRIQTQLMTVTFLL